LAPVVSRRTHQDSATGLPPPRNISFAGTPTDKGGGKRRPKGEKKTKTRIYNLIGLEAANGRSGKKRRGIKTPEEEKKIKMEEIPFFIPDLIHPGEQRNTEEGDHRRIILVSLMLLHEKEGESRNRKRKISSRMFTKSTARR